MDSLLRAATMRAQFSHSPPPRVSSPAQYFGFQPSSSPGGVRTPVPESRYKRRKTTILSLIDELSQMRDEDSEKDHTPALPQTEEKRAAAQDDVLEKQGVADFESFDRRIKGLQSELQGFTNAVRQLGSSVGLVSSAYRLRARLAQVLHLFRDNAAELFESVEKERIDPPIPQRHRKRMKLSPSHKMTPDVEICSDPELLPTELQLLAIDLNTFLNCLNQIPEFTDEAVNLTVMSFQADLRYWSSCLREFKDQFRFPAVERYVNDLTGEMEDHLENITEALTTFVEIGVPTIRFTQKHTANGLQNLSTVATFFSAVTATTIQYSYDQTGTHLKEAVNLLWIVSLVFSLASAINSQLAYHWRSASYRSPRSVVPWWVSIWISRTPLLFLVASVIAFSAGLVCFTFSVFGGSFIPIVTTVCTSFTSFALLAVGLWFAGERYAFVKTKGKRWLAEVLDDVAASIKYYTGVRWLLRFLSRQFRKVVHWCRAQFGRAQGIAQQAKITLYRSSSSVLSSTNTTNGNAHHSMSRDTLPFAATPEPPISEPDPDERRRTFSDASTSRTRVAFSAAAMTSIQEVNLEKGGPSLPIPESEEPTESTGLRNFRSLVATVMRLNRSLPPGLPRSATGLGSIAPSSGNGNASSTTRRRRETLENAPRRPSHLAITIPALRGLMTTQYLNEHSALVRHLEFSPSGKYFATCSWDRTAIIWRVGHPFTVHRKLAHAAGFVGQVAWSPDGTYLLTKTTRTVKLWSAETGVCLKTINRGQHVQSVTWMRRKRAFISVEGTQLHIIELEGNIKTTHQLDRLQIHDVAVLPDEQRLIAVATLEESPDGLVPSKSRYEKRIVVYNLINGVIENQVPVLHDVRHVSLSEDGSLVLVSYENKASPQLFRMTMIRDQARLSLITTYTPPRPVDFAGPSYLCHLNGTGKEGHIVLCAGKGGEIHIWDRETGALLHSLRAQDGDQPSDLTGIAWNHASPGIMFSSSSHDGTVQVWTGPLPSVMHAPMVTPMGFGGAVVESPREMAPGASLFG